MANNLIYDPGYVPTSSPSSSTSPSSTQSQSDLANNTSSSNLSGQQARQKAQDDQQNMQIKNRLPGYDMHNRAKDFNLASVRVMLKVCLLFNSMDYRHCPIGYEMSVQSFTNIFTNLQLSVPYPYMGKWYLAIWKECFDLNTK